MLMKITRYPVFAPTWRGIANLGNDIDALFDTFLRPDYATGIRQAPPMELTESENESVLVMELPGVAKEDVKVTVEEGVLSISGERKAPAVPENGRWLRNESASGAFVRTIELPHPVDAAKIAAELKNGLLRVVLPKAEQARPREITIR